ncbi:MAG: 50S ribosomal protein L35 [Clostridiales bacterium]|nr:50S ribosomal protein L35 [Clostridiales bacterium]
MPKIKTHSGAKKRFKITGTGKVKQNSTKRRHKLGKKTRKLKRSLRMPAYSDSTNVKQVKSLLPYK